MSTDISAHAPPPMASSEPPMRTHRTSGLCVSGESSGGTMSSTGSRSVSYVTTMAFELKALHGSAGYSGPVAGWMLGSAVVSRRPWTVRRAMTGASITAMSCAPVGEVVVHRDAGLLVDRPDLDIHAAEHLADRQAVERVLLGDADVDRCRAREQHRAPVRRLTQGRGRELAQQLRDLRLTAGVVREDPEAEHGEEAEAVGIALGVQRPDNRREDAMAGGALHGPDVEAAADLLLEGDLRELLRVGEDLTPAGEPLLGAFAQVHDPRVDVWLALVEH